MTTPLPTPPNTIRPDTFASESDTFLAALPTFQTQMDALGAQAVLDAASAAADKTLAAASATAASDSASAAALTAGAAAWVAGTYALNANAISPLDGQTYRNYVSAGVRNTDPKNDPANWVKLGAPAELWTKGANIASAATINLTTATGDYVHVTGTTTITAITIPVGAERTAIFDGILTLTHGAALLLPGAANITTAANDRMTLRGDTAGAIVVGYTRASGLPVVSTTPGLSAPLATLTPTASAYVDFLTTFTASYDSYLIVGENIGTNAATNDTIRICFANAGVVDAGSNYYTATQGANSSSAVTSGLGGGAFYTTGSGLNFTLRVFNVNSTALKSALWEANGSGETGMFFSALNWTCYNPASTVSGIRLFLSGGNNFKAQGAIRVYGISKT